MKRKKKKSLSGDLLMCDVDMKIKFHLEFNPLELLGGRERGRERESLIGKKIKGWYIIGVSCQSLGLFLVTLLDEGH